MVAAGCVVLIVDDEPVVLATLAARLRRMGYEVLEATSGPEALAILESRGDIDLVLSGCTMAPVPGPELARSVLQRWPHISFVAMSGKPRSPDLPDEVPFFSKPLKAADFATIVETVRQ